jgi:hypothetical protein
MCAQRLFTRTLKENIQQLLLTNIAPYYILRPFQRYVRNQPSRNPGLPRLQSLKASGKKRGLESDKDSFVLGSS